MTEIYYDRIKKLFDDLPQHYAERSAAITQLDRAFHQAMATSLQSALKLEMAQRPHGTYEEKKEFSKWINGELRRYGLAIAGRVNKRDGDGETQELVVPSILCVDQRDTTEKEGRFRIMCKVDSSRPIYPVTTRSLPTLLSHFEVMADDPNRRRTRKWTERHASEEEKDRGIEGR